MKGLQKKLQAVASMSAEEARAELSRVSALIESRYGPNRFRSRPLRPSEKVQAAQLRRLRSKLRERIQAEEGT
jgi:hypothetical protein